MDGEFSTHFLIRTSIWSLANENISHFLNKNKLQSWRNKKIICVESRDNNELMEKFLVAFLSSGDVLLLQCFDFLGNVFFFLRFLFYHHPNSESKLNPIFSLNWRESPKTLRLDSRSEMVKNLF